MDGADLGRDARSETRLSLLSHAKRRFGKIPEQLVVDHVTEQMVDADWVTLKAALDALARRHGFAVRDGLVVATPLRISMPLRTYRTRGQQDKQRTPRPYETALLSLAPLRMSCSCADFVRSSLGLCKHCLVVMEALHGQSGKKGLRASAPATVEASTLVWDSFQPPLSSSDRLARLRLLQPARRSPLQGWKDGRLSARTLSDPEQRLSVIRGLQKLIERGRIEAEPAVPTLLAEEQARAARALDHASGVSAALPMLKTLQRKLYPYQRAGVKRFFEAGRLLLADDMGLGKTTQAIAACHGLFEAGLIRRGLLIVPAALKGQWQREWESTTSVPLTRVEGSQAERIQLYAHAKRGFLIIGYEQLLRDFAAVSKYQPEIVVLDEAQRIKNWATKSAAYVKALDPKYRLVLTGTPMENRFDELASIMDFVDDLALEPKWRLTPFHNTEGNTGARHLSTLRARLSHAMLRRARTEVLSELPARSDTRVPVELTPVQRDAHEDLRRPIASLLQAAAKRPLKQPEFLQLMSLLTRQRMICNGMAQVGFQQDWPRCQAAQPNHAFLETLFAPKLSALRGLVEQVVLGQQRKAVVFSQWRNMIRLSEWAVRDLLSRANARAVFFTGAESPRQREQAIVDFHDDPRAVIMFLTDAGGVGLNLQHAASCCINLELPWNPAVLEQRIGRIYRLGQRAPIDVYNLVGENCIESRIAVLVENKRAVFAGLFDGTSDEVVFQGQSSFLDGIKKLVEPVPVPLKAAEELDHPVTDGLDPEPAAPPPSEDFTQGLQIERLDDGSLRIAAPPHLAKSLATLLEQLAQGLRSSHSPSP
jgi:superfamily II DNA or RNA helicase